MKQIQKLAGMMLCLFVVAGLMQPAQAQLGGLGGKLKQKAQQAAEKAAKKKANDAAETAVEDAAEEVVDDAAKSAGIVPTGGGALGGSASGGSTATIDFRELKALLPENLAGMTREEATGEKSAALGFATSNASGSYRADDGESIDVKITDLGTVRNWAMFGYGWMGAEIDRETENGYERTFKYQDKYPGRVEYSQDGDYKNADLSVFVGERFIVEIEGSGVEMAAVEAALARVDLGKLESMKGVGAGEGLEVADFQVLKGLLPASVGSLSRKSAEGQKTNTMNIVTSYAEGRYEAGDARLTLKIQDVGTMQGMTALGYGWLAGQTETETDTGYERTGKYKDQHPAHERFNNANGNSNGQLEIFVNQRYLISAEGTGVTMDQIKAAVDAVELTKLPAPKQ